MPAESSLSAARSHQAVPNTAPGDWHNPHLFKKQLSPFQISGAVIRVLRMNYARRHEGQKHGPCGQVGQVVVFRSRRKPEEPLEAKHAFQRLESVAEGIQAPPA